MLRTENFRKRARINVLVGVIAARGQRRVNLTDPILFYGFICRFREKCNNERCRDLFSTQLACVYFLQNYYFSIIDLVNF